MSTRDALHAAIDQLDDSQLAELMATAERLRNQTQESTWERLRNIPGIELPSDWPARFESFEPIRVEGEPVSQQLIRERR